MSGQSKSLQKRVVTRRTAEKWITESEKELDTTIWLKYDTVVGDRDHVFALKCGVCIQFNKRFVSL